MPALRNGRKLRGPCPACGKVFQPMTDAMWRSAWRTHQESSARHLRALGKTPRPAKNTLPRVAGHGKATSAFTPPGVLTGWP